MAEETKVIRIVVDSSRAVDGSAAATRAWERMEKAQASAATSMERMEAALGRVGGYLKAQLALMVADVANRMLSMAKGALDAAANMGELADQLGITVRGLQSLQFAAVQNNVKLEQLETGVSKFSQKMGEAAEGSKEMIQALDRIGVKILDANGKLRPTETLMQNVAAAIMAIDDPAKRAAAAVDFFGKAGTRMLPLLPEIAKGMDAMAQSAKNAGAMISTEAIAKLDKLADSGEKAKLQMRAMFAENAAEPLTQALDFISRKLENLQAIIKSASFDLSGLLKMGFYSLNPGALVGQLLAATPAESLSKNIASSQADIANLEGLLGSATSDRDRARLQTALDKARSDLSGYQRQQQVMNVGGKSGPSYPDPDNMGVFPTQRPGASNPRPTGGGGGETPAEKYAKLTVKLQETARAQDEMTAAAARGDVAFTEAAVHLDAVQKTLEIFGRRLADNDPLLVEMEARLLRIARGKIAESFNVATTELEKQNVVLQRQIELMNEAPEIQAREIALIKAKQEAEKGGAAVTADMIEARRKAIEQNETLKSQQEDLKKSQELWLSPIKSALESIQQTTADWIDGLLDGLQKGKLSFADFGQAAMGILRRMVSEILSLAVIRPMLGGVLNGLAGMGIIGSNTVRQLGYGGAGAGGIGMPSFGGGMGGGLAGWTAPSWLGGGQPFAFLNRPISGSTALPYGQFGPPAPGQAFGGWAESLTWGQGLGAAAGAGMGIYQLATSRSTGQTIGGIASLVGAGASLIPGIGQIAGPIISVLGAVLPALFGGGTPEPPTMRASAALNFRGGRFVSSGGAYGGASEIDLSPVGTSMKALLDAAKVKSLDSPFGLLQQTYAKGDFSNATTFVTGPDGQRQWGQSSDPAQQAKALDTAAAHTAHKIMMEIGSGISDIMRRGLSRYGQDNLQHAFSTQELATAVGEIKAFEDAIKELGKTTTSVEQVLKGIDEQFQGLIDTGNRYGLDNAPVQAEKQRERAKVAEDFAEGIQRELDLLQDPTGVKVAIADATKEREELVENNRAIVAAFGASQDQIANIEAIYAAKRIKIAEDAAKAQTASVQGLQDVIRRLQYGDLSTASPEMTLSGTRATFEAALAQSRAGDASATASLAGYATSYADAGRQFYGTGSGFQAINQQIQAALGERVATTLAPAAANGNTASVNAMTMQFGEMQAMMAQLMRQISEQNAKITALTAELQRRRAA